ncbi:DUF4783 domain-containing protein [Mucilaginibacter phyllosphaerae]|nr:DUF4783 domain-containing protein [Mucilaginibacter phyllosphaerae]MBB3967806.1 hypothetical protein [Mucilaginibacter phyllosphaerae]
MPMLALLFMLPLAVKADAIEKIAEYLKKGSSTELSQLFANSVDVSIANESSVYSKTQAQMILDKFFKENKPHGVKLLHRVSSNPSYNFAVYILTTDKGKFRIACTLKEVNKVMEIIELRVETEKT